MYHPGHSISGNPMGLTAFQIKMIALIAMTIDHVGAYGAALPMVQQCWMLLRGIGRISAPLFLFVLVQGLRYTRSRFRLIIRLYLAGACTGLFTALTNNSFGSLYGRLPAGTIFFTLFYVALMVDLTERFLQNAGGRPLLLLAAAAVVVLPNMLYEMCAFQNPLLKDLRDGLIPALAHVEYSWGFVMLGVMLYYGENKTRQCTIFAGFCLFCLIGAFYGADIPGSFSRVFFRPLQGWMLLALPIMLLYNGRPGPGCKWLFYGYYPAHRFLLLILCAHLAP